MIAILGVVILILIITCIYIYRTSAKKIKVLEEDNRSNTGNDLPSCKDIVKENQELRNKMEQLAEESISKNESLASDNENLLNIALSLANQLPES